MRCGRNGLGSSSHPACVNCLVHEAGEGRELRLAFAHPEPQRPWPAVRREGPGAADRDVERPAGRGRRTHGLARRAQAFIEGGPQELKGQVEAVEPDPADVATTTGHPVRAHPLDERRDPRRRVVGDRDGDEDAAARQVGTRVPGSTRGPGHPGAFARLAHPGIPVLAQHLEGAHVVPPAHHVDGLVLECLVGLEEVLDLDEPVRPNLFKTLDVLLVGVADGDAQDLEIEALLVAHLEPADRARPDVAARERGLVDDQQGVGVVAVARARPFDEAVVEVVVDGA